MSGNQRLLNVQGNDLLQEKNYKHQIVVFKKLDMGITRYKT